MGQDKGRRQQGSESLLETIFILICSSLKSINCTVELIPFYTNVGMEGLLYILVTKLMEISHLLQGMTSLVIQLPIRQ